MAVTYGLLILKWKAYCQNWCQLPVLTPVAQFQMERDPVYTGLELSCLDRADQLCAWVEKQFIHMYNFEKLSFEAY